MTRSIRLLAPKEALRDDEIRVILRTMGHKEYPLAVKDNQHVCDLFLFASHLFDVNFTRISLALDRNDETYAVSGGYQILDGYEPITQLVEPLKAAGHILEVLIKDKHDAHSSEEEEDLVQAEHLAQAEHLSHTISVKVLRFHYTWGHVSNLPLPHP